MKDIIGWSSWTLENEQRGKRKFRQFSKLRRVWQSSWTAAYTFLSVRSSKLYPRILWCVSEARTVRPSAIHHRHCTRTPSHDSNRFPSRSCPITTNQSLLKSSLANPDNQTSLLPFWTYTLVELPSLSSCNEALAVRVPGHAGQAVLMRLTHLCPQFSCLTTRWKKRDRGHARDFGYSNSVPVAQW